MIRRPIRRRGYNLSDKEFKLQLMEQRYLRRKARQAEQAEQAAAKRKRYGG